MIAGLGIDIVHVGRLRRWLGLRGLVERYFHPAEIEAARSRGPGMALSLAARFAAKEAFGKAMGIGLAGVKLSDIQVLNNHNGKPDIVLHGTAAALFGRAGGGAIHLSLTHDGNNAVAVVVIEREALRERQGGVGRDGAGEAGVAHSAAGEPRGPSGSVDPAAWTGLL